MAVEDVLDLGGGDVLAADADDVLEAAEEFEAAFGVDATEVAGGEPAVGGEGLGGLLGLVEVGLHDGVAADLDLALAGEADLDAGLRAHEGGGADGFGLPPAGLGNVGAGFGEAVADDAFAGAEFRDDAGDDGGGGGDPGAAEVEVPAGAVGGG